MNDSEATERLHEGDAEERPGSGAADTPESSDASVAREELADLIQNAETKDAPADAGNDADVPPPFDASATEPSEGEAQQSGQANEQPDDQADADPSGSYVYPDGNAASSQRHRLIPPDGKPQQWWVRYRRQLIAAEWFFTGLFFLLALYFLYQWLFGGLAFACLPDASWKMDAPPGRWRQIVVHHTATERSSPQSIDRFHREVRKWEGLGYHFLIGNGRSNGRDPTFGDGAVHAGIRWLEQRGGAHVRMKNVKNANSFSIGIALIGNFENEPPTPRQLAALRCLLGFLTKEYGIPRDKIFGHGEVSEKHTLCPGKLLPLAKIVASLQ